MSGKGSDAARFSPSLSAEQQRELAKRLTTFLSHYRQLSDSYIIVSNAQMSQYRRVLLLPE